MSAAVRRKVRSRPSSKDAGGPLRAAGKDPKSLPLPPRKSNIWMDPFGIDRLHSESGTPIRGPRADRSRLHWPEKEWPTRARAVSVVPGRFVEGAYSERRGPPARSSRRVGRRDRNPPEFSTIGRRRGLGLSHGPFHVSGKDAAENRIPVRHGSPRPASRFRLGAFHWIAGAPPQSVPESPTVEVRHGPDLVPATRRLPEPTPAGSEPQPSESIPSRPDEGVAPGQFAVFYAGPRCLGSARITSRGA